MIQRIQSVFLFVIFVLLCIALFQIAWKNTGSLKTSNDTVAIVIDPLKTVTYGLAGDGSAVQDEDAKFFNEGALKEQKSNYYIAVLIVLAALNSLFIIFKFKNRILQVRLAGLNYLLLSGILVAYYLLIKNANASLVNAGKGDFLFDFYVPIACILLNFLAIRSIRKDEALVRSVDRIR